ncbi:hypothetical protein [Streptomyces sp. NPDC091040]|uniref:hypothetical protein n=1 Tax=Streptomyces sp. NPDC091040 TaxID=3365972 RepID=UPI003823FB34
MTYVPGSTPRQPSAPSGPRSWPPTRAACTRPPGCTPTSAAVTWCSRRAICVRRSCSASAPTTRSSGRSSWWPYGARTTAGFFPPARMTALGALLSGAAPGRTSPDQITVFCSVGLAGTEVAVAAALCECV